MVIKKERDEKELIQIEKEIALIEGTEGGGYLNLESKIHLELLVEIKKKKVVNGARGGLEA